MRQTETPYYIKRNLVVGRNAVEGYNRPLLLQFNSLDRIAVTRDYHYQPHLHAYYELIMPLEGVYECALNGSPLTVKPGELLLVQHADRHEDFYYRGRSFAALLFHLRDFSRKYWQHGVIDGNAPPSSRIVAIPPESSLDVLKKLILTEAEQNRDPMPAVESLSEAFFWMLASSLPEAKLSVPFLNCLRHDAFRRQIFAFFAHEAYRKMDMKTLAAKLGMSPRSLDYKCNAMLGTTPAKAFTGYKMHEAVMLLESGITVKETAEQLGFADQFHFSKVFKRFMGFPPSETVRNR